MAVPLTRDPYRIERGQDVVRRLDEIHADLHLRLVRSESRDTIIDAGARAIADRGARIIEQELVPRATELGVLLEGYREGVSAGQVAETPERRFLSDVVIADLLARLTEAEVTALIAAALDALAIGDIDDLSTELAAKASIEFVRAELASLGISAFVSGLLNDPDAAAARTTLGAQAATTTAAVTMPAIRTGESRFRDRHDIRDYDGVDRFGNNSMTTLFQRAWNDNKASGEKLNFPPGIFALDGTISSDGRGRFEGVAPTRSLFQAGLGVSPQNGTWFKIAHAGKGFVHTDAGGSSEYVGVGTYRNQPVPGVGWAPGAFDYDFSFTNNDPILRQVCLLNPTLGVQSDVGRLQLDGVWGQPLQIGVHVRTAVDVVSIPHIHFYPLWSQNENVELYTLGNAEAIRWGKVDNPQIGRFFCYGYRYGWRFTYHDGLTGANLPGVTTALQAAKVQFDAIQQGIVVDAGASGVNGAISLLIMAQKPTRTDELPMLHLVGPDALFDVTTLKALYAYASVANTAGAGSELTVVHADVQGNPAAGLAGWDRKGVGYAAFQAGPGTKIKVGTHRLKNAGSAGAAPTFGGQCQVLLDRGQFGGNTNAAGEILIPHTGGCIPSYSFLHVVGGGDGLDARATVSTAQNITAKVTNGNGTAIANTAVGIAFQIYK